MEYAKFTLLALSFVYLTEVSEAQVVKDQNLSVPSPGVASFGLFDEVPVSLYSGLPEINVPLYELSSGDITVPISLSYHASGFKPDIKPGIVAPDWKLDMGGMIYRTVKDRPDDMNLTLSDTKEGQLSAYEVYRYNYSGFYFSKDTLRHHVLLNGYTLPFLTNFAFPDNTPYPLDYTLLEYRDTEPDEFAFHFPGGAGKFYMDIDGTWRVKSDRPLKVEFHGSFLPVPFELPGYSIEPPEGYPNYRHFYGNYKTFSGFTITDEHGTRYIYGTGTDFIEYSIDFINQDRDFWQADAWMLKEIISPYGERMTYRYERRGFTDQLSESITWLKEIRYRDGNSPLYSISCGGSMSSPKSTYLGRLVSPLYLSEIRTDTHRVILEYEVNNASRYASTYVHPSVSPTNVYGNIFEYFAGFVNGARRDDPGEPNADFPYFYNTIIFPYLIQYYRESGTNLHVQGTDDVNPYSANFARFYASFLNDYRVKSVTVFNHVNGEEDEEPVDMEPGNGIVRDTSLLRRYMFSYTSLGQTNRYNLGELKLYDGNGTEYPFYRFTYNALDSNVYYFSGRVDHWGFFTDRDIYNVTFSDLFNNPAQYYNARNPDLQCTKRGVLSRINYPTGGFAEFDYELNDAYYRVDAERSGNLLVHDGQVGGLRVKKITSSALSPDSPPIIKEYFYVNGYDLPGTPRSSGVLAYQSQYAFNEFETKGQGNVTIVKTLFSTVSHLPKSSNSQGSHIGYSEVVEKSPDGSFIKYYFTNYDNGHKDEASINLNIDISPYQPYTSVEQERGNLYRKESYDSNSRLVERTDTEYENLNKGLEYVMAIYLNKDKLCTNWYDVQGKFYKNYYYSVLPARQTITTFNYEGAALQDSLVRWEEYSYHDHKGIYETAWSNSQGAVQRKRIRYSFDLADEELGDPFGSAINQLRSDHRLVPIEEIDFLGTQVVAAAVNEYSLALLDNGAGPYPMPAAIHTWDRHGSSPYGQLARQGSQLVRSGGLDERYSFAHYNRYGKAGQVTANGYDTTSYIWSYYGTMPLAIVRNACYGDLLVQFGDDVLKNIQGSYPDTAFAASLAQYLRASLPKASVLSYTMRPGLGIASHTEANGLVNRYEYDGLGRLYAVRDGEGKLLQSYCYTYTGQLIECGPVFYQSAALQRTLRRNNCGPGYHGTEVTYVVEEGKYQAPTLQEANALALADLDANAQAYANANGQCLADGVYAWTCTGSWQSYTSNEYRYSYADVYIMVSRDAEGRLGISGSHQITYSNGQGAQQQVTVTGNVHYLGNLLMRREYVGYIPPDMAGELIEYMYEVVPKPSYTVISWGATPCGEGVDDEPDEPVAPIGSASYRVSPTYAGLCGSTWYMDCHVVTAGGVSYLYSADIETDMPTGHYFRAPDGRSYLVGHDHAMAEQPWLDCGDEEEEPGPVPGGGAQVAGYLYAATQAGLCQQVAYMEVHEVTVGYTTYLYDNTLPAVYVPAGYYRSTSGLDYQVGANGIRVKVTDAACGEWTGMSYATMHEDLCSPVPMSEVYLVRVGGQRYLYTEDTQATKATVGYYRDADGKDYQVDATGLMTELPQLDCGGAWVAMKQAATHQGLCGLLPMAELYMVQVGQATYLYTDNTQTMKAPVGYYRSAGDRDYQVDATGLATELPYLICDEEEEGIPIEPPLARIADKRK